MLDSLVSLLTGGFAEAAGHFSVSVMSKRKVSGRKTSWRICGREVSMSERGADWIILENALLSTGLADGALRFGGTGIGLYPF